MDRTIAKLMTAPANMNHKVFGFEFTGYVECCHQQRAAPRGRVLIALCALRFRLDRSRGRTLTVLSLYSLELHSFKLADIADFVGRVRYTLAHLRESEF